MDIASYQRTLRWHALRQALWAQARKFCECVLFLQVDPPRAGLDPATEALLPEFANVVYISCNPATLEANLRPLLTTHALRRFAVFDQARPAAALA